MRAAAVVPGTRVGRCGDKKREGVGLCLSPQGCSPGGAGNKGQARTQKNGCFRGPGPYTSPHLIPRAAYRVYFLCRPFYGQEHGGRKHSRHPLARPHQLPLRPQPPLCTACLSWCSGLGDGPHISTFSCLESVNVTLFGKRVCTDVIKLGIRRGDHPGFSGWALNPTTGVLLRDHRGGADADRHRGEVCVVTEAEPGGLWSQGAPATTTNGRGSEPPTPTASRRGAARCHLDLGRLASSL